MVIQALVFLARRSSAVTQPEVNRLLALHMLKREGHSVVIAHDGKQVLSLLETGKFDVVLMDLQMPVLDGYNAVRMMRAGKAKDSSVQQIVAFQNFPPHF